ncbi:hypothetical protein J2X06_001127 [Lysobacter niastensis]|uniref:AsmA family protein n=1 Tax=Lysobacter niastensis TaxID=380629 RepID=A0ABU1W8M6_9GAMM|nr:hypothetical protein [Lysobacter niastensis]MDR7133943.1 hypothetical protein [Lysobacter niastensis]
MPAPETRQQERPRSRRPVVWIAIAVIVLLLLLALRWVSQPSQIAGLILRQVGHALGLEITARGASEYRLRGTPMLAIRDVVARQPGASTPLLRAERIRLELPWSTVRARGADLTITRIELDAPQVDIAALQRWLATRPPSKTRIPTLTDGLHMVRGRVTGDGWSVEAIDLDLPDLHPQQPAKAQLRGRLISGEVRVPFDLDAAMTRPAAGAGVGLSGDISIQSKPWTLATDTTLSGRLHSGDDGVGLDRLRVAADAHYRNGDADQPFVLGLAGRLRMHEGDLDIAPLGLAVRGHGLIPTLDARGGFELGDALAMQLDGDIAQWPESWPALPAPIGQSTSSLPFQLMYRGQADLSAVTSLQLHRDGTAFDGRFRLPQMLNWIDAGAQGSPLPPLDGRLASPRIEIAGVVLEGIEIQFGDDAPTSP